MSFAPTTKVGYEGGLAHDRLVMETIRKTSGAADGGGYTPKTEAPKVVQEVDTVVIGGEAKDKGVSKKKMISTAVLLAGGAIVGFLCKDPIMKGVAAVKDKAAKFFAEGKPAELLAQGQDLLEKAKSLIFAAPPKA